MPYIPFFDVFVPAWKTRKASNHAGLRADYHPPSVYRFRSIYQGRRSFLTPLLATLRCSLRTLRAFVADSPFHQTQPPAAFATWQAGQGKSTLTHQPIA